MPFTWEGSQCKGWSILADIPLLEHGVFRLEQKHSGSSHSSDLTCPHALQRKHWDAHLDAQLMHASTDTAKEIQPNPESSFPEQIFFIIFIRLRGNRLRVVKISKGTKITFFSLHLFYPNHTIASPPHTHPTEIQSLKSKERYIHYYFFCNC